jgi:hypothetical protein
MAVALSSLRVVVEGNADSYTRAMGDVEKSSDAATASVNKFTDAQGNQVTYLNRGADALSSASTRFERLQRSLDPVHAAQTRLTQAQTTLQGALDRGVISLERYNELMSKASQRFEESGKKAGPLREVFSGISAQLIALSEGAGPLGVEDISDRGAVEGRGRGHHVSVNVHQTNNIHGVNDPKEMERVVTRNNTGLADALRQRADAMRSQLQSVQ